MRMEHAPQGWRKASRLLDTSAVEAVALLAMLPETHSVRFRQGNGRDYMVCFRA